MEEIIKAFQGRLLVAAFEADPNWSDEIDMLSGRLAIAGDRCTGDIARIRAADKRRIVVATYEITTISYPMHSIYEFAIVAGLARFDLGSAEITGLVVTPRDQKRWDRALARAMPVLRADPPARP